MSLRNINCILLVVLLAVIIFWPGVGQQFGLQVRQITGTTDVRINDWPGWQHPSQRQMKRPVPVPLQKLRRIAEKRDRNGDLWLGLAEVEQSSEDRLKAYDKALEANPAARVTLVRAAVEHVARLSYIRPEEAEYERRSNPDFPTSYPGHLAPRDAEACLRILRAGARIEPENSFYDYSLAYVYVGMGKDEEAVACMNRGWRKPVYSMHYKEAASSARRLLRLAGVPDLEATHAVRFAEHLPRVRQSARVLRILAVGAEEGGDWKKGWGLRLAAFRMGNQMIRRGETALHSLVGVAAQMIAMRLPLSDDVSERLRNVPESDRNELSNQARVDALRAYVRDHQLGSEGDWVVEQYLAGTKFHELTRRASRAPAQMDPWYRLIRFDYLWYGSTILLVQLLGVLLVLAVLSSVPAAKLTGARGLGLPAVTGVFGALATAGVALYVGWPWWVFASQHLESAYGQSASIPAATTWKMVEILPALVLLGALIVLAVSRQDRLRQALRALYTSARFALPALVVLYIVASVVTSGYRSQYERYVMDWLQPGQEARQVECLKKSGFIQENVR